uniref:Uncharacterized protein n=1 Tax=Meloidogyne enterolobii TaxID=390850 RepID=A0A6V7VQY4_MELEN|nr:unnamed protein product [Meloidogyne enterolobii]
MAFYFSITFGSGIILETGFKLGRGILIEKIRQSLLKVPNVLILLTHSVQL